MLNPILSFSATRRMRSFKTLLVVLAYILVLLGTALLLMGRLFSAGVSIAALRSGVTCYQVLMILQFALIILIAPAMTSGAIAGERERQTLELLLVTNTRSFRIVWGKAMESFAVLALLIVCGLPVMCTPYWPGEAEAVLLTRASACDPDVVDKLEAYVAGGGKALVTSGFLESTMDRGIQRMTSIRFTGRRVRGANYRIETAPGRPQLSFERGAAEIGIPVCEFRNNSAWALVKVAESEESFGLLLRDTYGKGQMLTLAVPDSFPDLYKLPSAALSRIRREFPAQDVWLECGAGISLFPYDNGAFIVYPYATGISQPATVRIHVAGEVKALGMPVRKEFRSDQIRRVRPMYARDGETVFEVRTQPGQYELYRIIRE